jgi:iron(II)-dependent oxidoreductase
MEAMATLLERQETLLARLASARAMTDDLFRIVRREYQYERPIPERHRIIFYIGHLEAFDWNLIASQALGRAPAHKEFDRLFAFGIDPVGGGLPTDQPSDWPALPEVKAYVRNVREGLDSILTGTPSIPAQEWQYHRDTVLNVAIEHRLMHAETLAYMFHRLPIEQKVEPARPSTESLRRSPPVLPRMIVIPEGMATLGASREAGSFGWDNEFEAQSVLVPGFAIDAYKVTNGEFLQFVRGGAYEDGTLWSDADWEWIREQNITHPSFWRERQGHWLYRSMFEEFPLPLDWPAYVSHAEAAAYACFVGKSLPTEAQFHRAAYGTAEGEERTYPWGSEYPSEERGNFDFQRWDPVAVGNYPLGQSAFGVEDMVGNGWEWTSSAFAPFSGFEPFPFYRGYSANFFDGKHYVMKGGSPRTAACMLRRSFRNWFQGQYPFVYASFRCVSN